jgi:succinylglutamic semialdehyde dehydrogenase
VSGFTSIDPATGEVVWEGAAAGEREVAEAVATARAAFHGWAERPREERIAALRRYKTALEDRRDAFTQALSRETGKALWETTAELGSMIGKVEISIAAYDERTGVKASDTAFGRAVLRHRPHGVMAVLGPFNFPGHLPNGHIVPALLAGDTVVFKPSEETPLAGQLIAEAFEAAELPAGVINLVQGGRETGAALLEQDIDGLLFTGSAQAGAVFRRRFAERPDVILALELGGNNPLVVWDVADAEAAAGHIVQSAFITTGQRCSCARRLIVPTGAEGDEIVEAVAALADRLTIGPWNGEAEPFMGPLISARAAEGALQAAAKLGGDVVRRMGPVQGLSGAFVTPGIVDVTGVETPDEEIFAPVLQVRRVASFDEAMSAANATRYGLAAGLISDNPKLWERFLARIRAGVVNFNRPTTGAAGSMPFGGLGASGNHRASAYYAADYCAYPVASFEADAVVSTLPEIKGLRPTPTPAWRPATWPARSTPARSPIPARRCWRGWARCAGWPTGACRSSCWRRTSGR